MMDRTQSNPPRPYDVPLLARKLKFKWQCVQSIDNRYFIIISYGAYSSSRELFTQYISIDNTFYWKFIFRHAGRQLIEKIQEDCPGQNAI